VLPFKNNPLTGSRAIIWRVESGYEAIANRRFDTAGYLSRPCLLLKSVLGGLLWQASITVNGAGLIVHQYQAL